MSAADIIKHLPAPLQGAIAGVVGLGLAGGGSAAAFYGLETTLGGRPALFVGLGAGAAGIFVATVLLGDRFPSPIGRLVIVVAASAIAALVATASPIQWTWFPLIAAVLAAAAAGAALLRPRDPPEA